MAFEVYKPNITKRDSLIISLHHSGKIGFNAVATRMLQEEAIQSVVLLWDIGKYTLGIRAASKDEHFSFPISFHPKHSYAALSVKGFLKYIQWKAQERHLIHAKWNASEKRFEASIPARFIDTVGPSAPQGQPKKRSNRPDP